MKAIQITFDEDLLREVDATEEAQLKGRSALMRRAVAEYLQRRREALIDDQYRKAYGANVDPLADEFAGWEEQGTWPDE